MVEKGKMIQISFTGIDKSSNKVFDTTNEEEAKKAGIFVENGVYKPLSVIIGEGELLKGLDSAIQEMKVGEEKEIELSPKDAFGERNTDLVRLVPLKEFKKRNINPIPGMVVNLNEQYGRVQSISGGRVRVDFNPDLAGKPVMYRVKIEKELKTDEEKAGGIFVKFFPYVDEKNFKFKGKEIEILLPHDIAPKLRPDIKQAFSDQVMKHVDSVDAVMFVEEYTKDSEKKSEKSK